MSFFTAVMSGLGGYVKGRQQNQQNQQEQQRLSADTDYQHAMTEQSRRDSDIRALTAGYDPNTLKPLPMTGNYEQIPPHASYGQISDIAARNLATAASSERSGWA